MIEQSNYSVFGITESRKIDAITNTANTKGVMGAGLAYEFKLRYPQYYLEYNRRCANGEFKPGETWVYPLNDLKIITLFTKDDWRKPSKEDWIIRSLHSLRKRIEVYEFNTIALPLPGAGLGKMNKEFVLQKIKEEFLGLKYSVIVCFDKIPSESEINAINNLYNSNNINKQKNSKIIERVRQQKIIKRFRDILKINGIGKKSYEKLFNYFVLSETKEQETGKQNKLFE